MDSTVPLWAFIAVALFGPVLALAGVVISVTVENKRSHRSWLREKKYEQYQELDVAYSGLIEAYSAFLDAETLSKRHISRLKEASRKCREQANRCGLVSSMRVSLAIQSEIQPLAIAAYSIAEDAVPGQAPTKPTKGWETTLKRGKRYGLI